MACLGLVSCTLSDVAGFLLACCVMILRFRLGISSVWCMLFFVFFLLARIIWVFEVYIFNER